MKYLQETPSFICDNGEQNFCAYVDTDSNYFNAEPILLHKYPNFESYPDEKKDELLEDIALKYQDIITDFYGGLAIDCFNAEQFEWFDKPHWLEMKTECVIRSAYFRNTRRYAQWITKQEGIVKETLDIKGLEFMKTNFPKTLGDFFHNILVQTLKGATHTEILDQIKEFKEKILSGEIPLAELGNPTSVKKLDKYSGRKPRAGEMFTEIEKGCPAPVRAAIKYNDLLTFWGLDKNYNLITAYDKVKWTYLKDNPYKIEALAFLDYEMPPKIEEFFNQYADRKKIFDSILLNKLEGFFSDIGWSLDTNPYINAFKMLEV